MLPESVELCEVGPRDGFQFESKPIPTELKIRVIRELASAGLRRIQAVSFVHPDRVPQMVDAERVAASLPAGTGTVFSGLALNARGVRRAADAGLRAVDLSIATHPVHARDNAGMTVEEGVDMALSMIGEGRRLGLSVQLGLQTVFGYATPGDTPLDLVADLAARMAGAGIESLSLADSTGLAGPADVRRVVRAVRGAAPGTDLVLHLHDTRGLGLANVVAALEEGVSRFDTSLGGLGGCPFIPGATGNIATEDTLWLLERLGIAAGVDRAAVAAVTRTVAAHLGRDLPGRLYRLEGPPGP
jgi:hydroxymethylglutaryl-CoA lyase